MASMFQSVGVSAGWRKHQLLADIDENESPVPDKFKKRPSSSSLNTIRMSLRKRMPLKQVELNLHENPTWESLEAKEKPQTFRAITRTARNAFGTVSQKIQKSCQNPKQPLVTSPARAPASSAKKRSTPPQTPRRKNGFSRTAAPASGPRSTPRSSKRASLSSGSARSFQVKEWRSVSNWLGKDALPLRRSRRAAALKSPYSSPPPATGKRQAFECELELVSTGIQQLKRLSQVFDDAIVREESDMTVSLIRN
ncbi:PREDICTED: protein FAM64A isoform X2 [Gavialis gangeticus]|uniref:protein FAM64A isoform X2 n=1 Tax=Gavialis gangeticus TaxID=94835 RepID=UPI00092E703C|nr:PREDICTED: protein FAM64A isoform X2 [Gavialis gangeticus]